MKNTSMSDIELIRSCLQGEMEAYKEIMDRYHQKAFGLALNVLRNREDAEDACQESFLKAFRHLDRFDQQTSFKNWFYTLLYRSCVDQIRKKKRFFAFINKHKAVPGLVSPQHESEPNLDGGIEARLLLKLNPKERLSIYLWANEDYTSEEIATVLGCSPSTIRVYLFKARKKIKALLEKENGEL